MFAGDIHRIGTMGSTSQIGAKNMCLTGELIHFLILPRLIRTFGIAV